MEEEKGNHWGFEGSAGTVAGEHFIGIYLIFCQLLATGNYRHF